MAGRSSKVFIKRGTETTPFMWADLMADGSVMMGLLGEVLEEVEWVADVRGEVRRPTLITEAKQGRSKITFHPSGRAKLSVRVGVDRTMMDRATVQTPPLADIVTPRRMLEMILPAALPASTLAPTDRDVVVSVRETDGKPLRCTVSCMALGEIQKVADAGVLFVGTSVWEETGVLANGSHAWTWTFRVSRDDQAVAATRSKLHMVLLGPVKWGQPPTAALS